MCCAPPAPTRGSRPSRSQTARIRRDRSLPTPAWLAPHGLTASSVAPRPSLAERNLDIRGIEVVRTASNLTLGRGPMAYLRALGRKPALLSCVFVVVLSAALLLPVAAGASTGSHATAQAKPVVDARIGPAHPQAVSKGAPAGTTGVQVPRRAQRPSQPA